MDEKFLLKEKMMDESKFIRNRFYCKACGDETNTCRCDAPTIMQPVYEQEDECPFCGKPLWNSMEYACHTRTLAPTAQERTVKCWETEIAHLKGARDAYKDVVRVQGEQILKIEELVRDAHDYMEVLLVDNFTTPIRTMTKEWINRPVVQAIVEKT